MKFFSKVIVVGAPMALAALACSTEFSARACQSDGDCESDSVCVAAGAEGNETGKASSCVRGATLPALRIGISAVGEGPSQDLGQQMKAGINLAFAAQNQSGGVRHGRQLELVFEEDNYEPATAELNAKSLLDVQVRNGEAPRCPSTAKTDKTLALYPNGTNGVATTRLDRGPKSVLAVLGNVGTPTMARFAPIAIETQTLFFGAFTGATLLLRDDLAGPCKKFIFNVRGSYAEEARATMEYFIAKHAIKDYKHVISFDQNDSYGQAGYSGLVEAYKALQEPKELTALPATTDPIKRFRYTRENVDSVAKQAADAITYIKGIADADPSVTHKIGIFMTDTYQAGEAFIKAVQDWRMGTSPYNTKTELLFSNVSFVGPNSLADRLKGTKYTENVLVSQVVPNYQQDGNEIVKAYNEALKADPAARNFTSFEGYISARIFIAGLNSHNGPFTSEALVNTFEHLETKSNIELGTTSGFTPDDHNYSKSVWGTAIQADGSFTNTFFWREGAEVRVY